MSDDVLAKQLRGVSDCDAGCQCILCEAAGELNYLHARLSKALQAIGLLTTLGPGDMPIEDEDLVGMATKIEAHVRSRVEELERENKRLCDAIADAQSERVRESDPTTSSNDGHTTSNVDKRRLDWLEKQFGVGLIHDDNSAWALAGDGFQNCRMGEGPLKTTFYIESDEFYPSVRAAIDAAMFASNADDDYDGGLDDVTTSDARGKCDTTEGPCACGAWHHLDDFRTTDENGIPVNDNDSADNQPEQDYEPVYATLHFYYNDPDSMRRMRECLDARDVKIALSEYDNKLRAFVKYGVENTIYAEQEPEEVIRMVRELLYSYMDDYGIRLDEE